MVSARKKESQINLLPQKGFFSSTTGRVLSWILSTFRVIVIATEIIVMIAFLSRFWLDAQNTDLDDLIDQRQAAIAATLPFERNFRDIQERLIIYEGFITGNDYSSELMQTLTVNMPQEIILKTISISANSLDVEGVSPFEQPIQQYIVNLQSTGLFSQTDLLESTAVETDAPILEFKIRALLLQTEGEGS